MEKRGLKEGFQFATLTDIITKSWSDKTTKAYKILKGLKKRKSARQYDQYGINFKHAGRSINKRYFGGIESEDIF